MAPRRNPDNLTEPRKRSHVDADNEELPLPKKEKLADLVVNGVKLITLEQAKSRRAELENTLQAKLKLVEAQRQQLAEVELMIEELHLQNAQWQAQRDALVARPDPSLYKLPSNDPRLKVTSKPQQDLPMQPANPKYVDVQTQTEWWDRKQASRPKFIGKLLADREAKRMEERRRQRAEMVANFAAQKAKLKRQQEGAIAVLEDTHEHEVALKTLDGKHTAGLNALVDEHESALDDLEYRHAEALDTFDNKR
ncbi:uncharacterized protein RHO25_006728 [Cercospora beticola]|uniref:Uncharacterized protein n=1 Tax=Cercospora beticola TaxID=122368 RepID=A0ABZ0NRC1_CERBT|nr:hypothetical protein RHO25_006728 [Cercospora beticola]